MLHHYRRRESSVSPTTSAYSRDSTVSLALNDTDINSYQWNKNTTSILADTDSPSNTRNGVMIESVELIRLALMLVAVQQYCSINQPSLTTVIDIHTKPNDPFMDYADPIMEISLPIFHGREGPFFLRYPHLCYGGVIAQSWRHHSTSMCYVIGMGIESIIRIWRPKIVYIIVLL